MPEPYAAFQPGKIVRIRGERWIVRQRTAYASAAILDVGGVDRTNRLERTRFVLPFELADLLPSSDVPQVVRPRAWRRIARHILGEAVSPRDLLRTIVAADVSVFPFQLEPALAILRGLSPRVLIADEVGLGKTVQAGLILAELLARRPDTHALIVSPAGLRDQWRDELASRFGIDAALIDSAALARFGRGQVRGFNPWRSSPVVITSVDYVKRPEVLRSIEALVWDAVIFDEAHALSSRSDRAAAAAIIADRARILVLLSATPHSGDDIAFARLCDFGSLGQSRPMVVFRRTRQDVGMAASRRTTWLRVRPTREESELHLVLMDYARQVWTRPNASVSGARLAMTVLVRRACSSPQSLARSVARRLTLLENSGPSGALQALLPLGLVAEDDEPISPLHAAGLDNVDDELGRLTRIQKLADAASERESKQEAVARLLRRVQQPAIVFTEYRDTLAQLAGNLKELGIVTLHGGLTATERAESLKRFVRGDARVLIATDAASEGLNLQRRCRLVVNLELPWSPLRLEQRIGRVDRLGQRQRVHAVQLIASGTEEENTVARLFRRMARMQSSTADLQRPRLDEQDIARSVIGRESLPPDPQVVPSRLPSNLIAPDLRTSAGDEAARASAARLLLAGSTDTTPIYRPVVTTVRTRRRSQCYSAFRLAFDDASGIRRCDVLLGVKVSNKQPMPPSRAALRDLFTRHTNSARAVALTSQMKTLADVQALLDPCIDCAIERELAILDDVRRHHARMAARLLQPGLFDRRTERAASAQAAAANEVLACCATRLEELKPSKILTAGACDLLFAVNV